MSKSRYKSVSIIDFFYEYPYKQNIPHSGNTIPTPYIKKEDCVYNNMTLDYNEWRKIVLRYLELIMESLEEGNSFKLPLMLGILEIKKTKIKKFFDRVKSAKEGKQVYFKSNGLENRFIIIDWMRGYKEANFKFRWHWRLRPNRQFLKSLYEKADMDYTFLNRFKDKLYD